MVIFIVLQMQGHMYDFLFFCCHLQFTFPPFFCQFSFFNMTWHMVYTHTKFYFCFFTIIFVFINKRIDSFFLNVNLIFWVIFLKFGFDCRTKTKSQDCSFEDLEESSKEADVLYIRLHFF